jgi:hypothetical protein
MKNLTGKKIKMPRKIKENYVKEVKKSPFAIFKEWLFDGDMESEIPKESIFLASPRNVLNLFGAHGKLTIFLNEYFNNFESVKLNNVNFCKMIKEIIIKRGINKYSTTFYSNLKEDSGIVELKRKFPLLKSYEIPVLLKKMEQTEENTQFLEAIGKGTVKKEKMKKSEIITPSSTEEVPKKKRGRKKKNEVL